MLSMMALNIQSSERSNMDVTAGTVSLVRAAAAALQLRRETVSVAAGPGLRLCPVPLLGHQKELSHLSWVSIKLGYSNNSTLILRM